jgi:hypothetical protein
VLQFREDFDRDFSRVFLHFQSRQPLAPEEIPARYATLLADWKAKAPNPKLIKELYWVDATRAPELELHRLEAGQASKIEWPSEFRGVAEPGQGSGQVRDRQVSMPCNFF